MRYERLVWWLCGGVILLWAATALAGREVTPFLLAMLALPASLTVLVVRIAINVGAARR